MMLPILIAALWAQPKGVLLENLTWVEAEKALKPSTVVVIPIGAAAKEHGPHLRLNNDWLMAQWLSKAVRELADVVVAPTVNYHYYPAFIEYPGSTTLRLETARDVLIDICRSLARHGPKRFYALNTGVSTLRALEPAAAALAGEGIVLRYTNVLEVARAAEQKVRRQEGGTHADEIETSLMLYMAPETVDMRKAVKEYHAGRTKGRLSRDQKTEFTYSPSGVFGDATLATREKGEVVAKAMVAGILREIELLREEK
ncbi:MAG: creatininase family protein [Bryobacteraceae bacterium]|nr:creatininase family protein [Bryobacteraceae bacterium]